MIDSSCPARQVVISHLPLPYPVADFPPRRMDVESISTGALTLDVALGGGLPRGRVVEIYGPESR